MNYREVMLEVARSFNRHVDPARHVEGPQLPPPSAGGKRAGDDFNARAAWADVLEPAGWRCVGAAGGRLEWRRPGKDDGQSATTGYCKGDSGNDLLYVFSTNAAPFEAGSTYSKFAAYTLLNHGGDYRASHAALTAAGYGDPEAPAGRIVSNGVAVNGRVRANADNSSDPLDQDATAFDLIVMNSTIKWAWEGWLPVGVLTILAAEPGCGKTRFCADLARRVANGLPWPDGKPQTFPEGSRVLWVPADNQHPELGSLPGDFGFLPTLLYLNTTKRNPFGGTMLDDPSDLKDFEARIARIKPALVFIDTSLNATDKTAHKPEDAKAFFKPLQELAARQQVVMVCVTHLNAAGKPLGRRVEGQGRVVIMLAKPDPEQEFRRRLWVKKSNSLLPPVLGVTMGTHGNEYDNNPPDFVPEETTKKGPPPAKVRAAQEWLSAELEQGPAQVGPLRRKWETAGHSTSTMYRARDAIGAEEFEAEGRKWWRLTAIDSE